MILSQGSNSNLFHSVTGAKRAASSASGGEAVSGDPAKGAPARKRLAGSQNGSVSVSSSHFVFTSLHGNNATSSDRVDIDANSNTHMIARSQSTSSVRPSSQQSGSGSGSQTNSSLFAQLNATKLNKRKVGLSY